MFGGPDRLDNRKDGGKGRYPVLSLKHFFDKFSSCACSQHIYPSIRKCDVAQVASSLSYLKLVMKERNLLFYTKDQRF